MCLRDWHRPETASTLRLFIGRTLLPTTTHTLSFNHVFLYKCLLGRRPRGDAGPRLVALGRDAFFVALPARVFAQ